MCHARVAGHFRSRWVRFLCLLALAVAALLVLVYTLPPLCHYHHHPNDIVFVIPYRSNASVYRQKARYVTPLPRGDNRDVDKEAPAKAAATPPP